MMSVTEIKKLSFSQRPISLPAEYRPMYKIGIIVLILKISCRSETSSLLKLHLLSWAFGAHENLLSLDNFIKSDFKSNFSVWGIEPALNRALLYAVAENFCEIINGKNYKLADKGFQLCDLIEKDKTLFQTEKAFLKSIGKNTLTDTSINLFSQQWTLPYA